MINKNKCTELNRILLYRNLVNDELINLVCQMLDYEGAANKVKFEEYFYTISYKLIEYSRLYGSQGDVWQTYFIDLLLLDENPFSLGCERRSDDIDPQLRKMAWHDLENMKDLISLNWLNICKSAFIRLDCGYPYFQGMIPHDQARQEAKDKLLRLVGQPYPEAILEALESYYRQFGCGQLGRFSAFRWDNGLQPIAHPDPITMDMIIGYEYQKKVLLENTRAFVEGRPANNILLYGAKGTGKSSSVKALLHSFAEQGLRMVEITRRQLADINKITAQLRYRNYRFIIFIDDLSFEDFEVDYKYIKASMEGSLEARAQNILFYVTSNRRHLVRENWSDRQHGEEEVFPPDSQQEKLSFADRFGISLAYLSPDQELYLQIVREMAEKEEISMEREELRNKAIQWELSHHGRSGRSARQFIDDLLGRL